MEPESGTAADVVRVNGILQACTVGHGIRMSTSAYLSRHARCVTTHILCGKVRSKRVIFVVFSPKNFVPLPGSVTRTVGGILANLTAPSPLSAGTASPFGFCVVRAAPVYRGQVGVVARRRTRTLCGWAFCVMCGCRGWPTRYRL
jgi:hypothetical protein